MNHDLEPSALAAPARRPSDDPALRDALALAEVVRILRDGPRLRAAAGLAVRLLAFTVIEGAEMADEGKMVDVDHHEDDQAECDARVLYQAAEIARDQKRLERARKYVRKLSRAVKQENADGA
jgi:hypothetical protein